MISKEKLPISYLLFTTRGRIDRLTYWLASVFVWCTFYGLFVLLETAISYRSTLLLYPVLFWVMYALAVKRLQDGNKSGAWLWWVLLPVAGPVALIFLLGFKKGSKEANRFGSVPNSTPDYFKNPDAEKISDRMTEERIVNDVTQLNPVLVAKVETPQTIEALQAIVKSNDQPICIGGGRFSMGGQTASLQSVHIDLRGLNKVLEFSPEKKCIKVQAGIRWCDIQHHVDPYGLSIKIMQTYANFTVGGSLSVNCHGRYIGLGPVILSVMSLDVVLATGELVHTSPTERPELFYASIGGYNAVAIIVQVELELTDNIKVKRWHRKMPRKAYKDYFFADIRENKEVIFHNGDLYPPHFQTVRGVSWVQTEEKTTDETRLMPLAASYPLERYFIAAFSKSRFGKWRREFIVDPLLYRSKKVHWRNYEAGYDVLELEPASRKESTYVLQEYFVPVEKFDAFVPSMAEIFTRHQVNVLNVSIRHAQADSGSWLAWAKEEVFAFVVWYKQGTTEIDKNKVAVWTRELIEAALSFGGSYYLPYQPHATIAQFHQAYPQAKRLFELKKQLDPTYKFRNVVWDTYYAPQHFPSNSGL